MNAVLWLVLVVAGALMVALGVTLLREAGRRRSSSAHNYFDRY